MYAFPLEHLRPLWIPEGREWGAGVEFDCPVHPGHRLELLFRVGCAGWFLGRSRVDVLGTSFATLSATEWIYFPGCFTGALLVGEWLIRES